MSMRRSKKKRSARAGFSLLEVLASLVVTTLLVVALTPLTTQMLATWALGTEAVSMVELQARGLNVLRDDLIYAVVWGQHGRPEDSLGFRGNETSMSFPVASGLSEGRDGIEMVSIDVASSADGRALIRRRAAIVGARRTAFTDPVVLFSGSYRYFLRYYSEDGHEAAIWSDPSSLPARIAVNIVDERNRRSAISFQLPVFASAASACLVDTSLFGCPISPPQPVIDPALGYPMPGQ